MYLMYDLYERVIGKIRRVYYGWWIVTACFCLGLYAQGTVILGFTAFFLPIVAEFGWNYVQISLAMFFVSLVTGLMAPIVGFLADRRDPRQLVFSGTLVAGLGFMILSRTSSLAMFYGGFVLVAIGLASCNSTLLLTLVANWFGRDFGKAAGFVLSGLACGSLLIPVITGLINIWGCHTAFLILGLGMWLIGLPLSLVLRRCPKQRPDSCIALDEDCLNYPRVEIGSVVTTELKKVVTTRAFWQLTSASTLSVMGFTAVLTHVLPYLSSKGITTITGTVLATLIPILTIPGRLGFGWLGDIFPKKWVMSVALCAESLGFLIFSYVSAPWLCWLFIATFSPAHGGGTIMRRSVQRQYFGTTAFGCVHGLMQLIVMLGAAAGPVLAGWTFSSMQSYRMIWIVFAGLLLVVSVLIMTMPKASK